MPPDDNLEDVLISDDLATLIEANPGEQFTQIYDPDQGKLVWAVRSGGGGGGFSPTIRVVDSTTPVNSEGYIGANSNEFLLIDASEFEANQWISLPDSATGTKIMVGRIDLGSISIGIVTPDISSFGIRANPEFSNKLQYGDIYEFTSDGSNWYVTSSNSVLQSMYGVPLKSLQVITATADIYTANGGTVICDATGGDVILTIADNPLVSGSAMRVIRSDSSVNNVQIQFANGMLANVAEFPNGQSLGPGQSRVFFCDGTRWWITELNSVVPPDMPYFDDIVDVAITSPEDGQVPVYLAGAWQNTHLALPTLLQPASGGYSASSGMLLLVDATSGEADIQLPALSPLAAVFVKKIDSSANTVVLTTPGAEKIDGADTRILTDQYDSVSVVCDGSNWWVL